MSSEKNGENKIVRLEDYLKSGSKRRKLRRRSLKGIVDYGMLHVGNQIPIAESQITCDEGIFLCPNLEIFLDVQPGMRKKWDVWIALELVDDTCEERPVHYILFKKNFNPNAMPVELVVSIREIFQMNKEIDDIPHIIGIAIAHYLTGYTQLHIQRNRGFVEFTVIICKDRQQFVYQKNVRPSQLAGFIDCRNKQ